MLRILFILLVLPLFDCCAPSSNVIPGTILIENIDLIDPNEGLTKGQSITIAEGKILSVEAYDANKSVTASSVIDGTGKYIIPGLWDAHVHFAYMENLAPRMLDLFMIYGITSVRDTGGKIDFVKKWKQEASANPLGAPRVMIAGPLLDGNPNVYDGSDPLHPPLSIALENNADITEKVNALIEQGVDFLKVYEMLTPQQFATVIKLAKENGLQVTGHVPLSMDVVSAAEGGLNSIEHMRNVDLSCASNHAALLEQRQKLLFDGKSDAGGILRSRIHDAQRQNALENYDQSQADVVLQALKDNDTWQIPTMALNLGSVNRPYTRVDFQDSYQYLPDSVKVLWQDLIAGYTQSEPSEFDKRYKEWKMNMIGQMHEKGIPILAGTDCPIFFLTPGLSLHEELFELVSSGLSPLEAIKSATYLPAKYFDLENELGSIKAGQWADLLILNENPLDNIRNTTSIETVIKQGNVLDQKILNEMKETLRAK